MSIYYTCDIHLEASFNKEILMHLIKKGERMGFLYLARSNYSQSTDPSKVFTTDEAVEHIIIGRTTKKDDFNFAKSLEIKYEDTYFTLSFNEKNNAIYLHMFPIANIWKKTFENQKYFDFGRYTKILINLCEDFPITNICTEMD